MKSETPKHYQYGDFTLISSEVTPGEIVTFVNQLTNNLIEVMNEEGLSINDYTFKCGVVPGTSIYVKFTLKE